MTEHFDIVIVGAGTVGVTLACLLGDEGFRVALVEARHPPESDGAVDPRVWALTPASERILRRIGAWERIDGAAIGAFREMEVWDAGGTGRIRFDSAEIGVPALGSIIANRRVQAALAESLCERAAVERIRPARPAALRFTRDAVEVALNDGGVLCAALVVGADGADSTVRRLAGIVADVHPYRQSAVVADVRTEIPHGEIARQRFLADGPLALLPLADGCSALVWSTAPAHAAALLAMDGEAFCAEVEQGTEAVLGRVLGTGPRTAFPLRLLRARAYVRTGLALVGDAAHTVHPLAGQGVNLGLLDAAALAEVLTQARRAGRAPGALGVLRRYERWRKGENQAMALVLDGFKRLFESPRAPVRRLRNLGLDLTDAAVPVKRLIMRRAGGLSGDLPAIARVAADG